MSQKESSDPSIRTFQSLAETGGPAPDPSFQDKERFWKGIRILERETSNGVNVTEDAQMNNMALLSYIHALQLSNRALKNFSDAAANGVSILSYQVGMVACITSP